MKKNQNFMTDLHTSTSRDYLGRMNDKKIESMDKARLFEFDYWDGERRFGYGGYQYIPGRWKQVAESLINEYKLNDNSRVLDIGCGKGFLLYEIQKILPKCELVGIDISRHAIKSVHHDFHGRLIHGDARETLPFKAQEFDLVISLATLHNFRINEVKQALSEIQRVGKNTYIMVESYRSVAELFNLECWALTAESFFHEDEWRWIFDNFGYAGDYEFIYFE